MRASRLLSLLLLLQNRGRMTALELADELEVSVRTIYRDAGALTAAGVPLYGDAGHAGESAPESPEWHFNLKGQKKRGPVTR